MVPAANGSSDKQPVRARAEFEQGCRAILHACHCWHASHGRLSELAVAWCPTVSIPLLPPDAVAGFQPTAMHKPCNPPPQQHSNVILLTHQHQRGDDQPGSQLSQGEGDVVIGSACNQRATVLQCVTQACEPSCAVMCCLAGPHLNHCGLVAPLLAPEWLCAQSTHVQHAQSPC